MAFDLCGKFCPTLVYLFGAFKCPCGGWLSRSAPPTKAPYFGRPRLGYPKLYPAIVAPSSGTFLSFSAQEPPIRYTFAVMSWCFQVSRSSRPAFKIPPVTISAVADFVWSGDCSRITPNMSRKLIIIRIYRPLVPAFFNALLILSMVQRMFTLQRTCSFVPSSLSASYSAHRSFSATPRIFTLAWRTSRCSRPLPPWLFFLFPGLSASKNLARNWPSSFL